MPSFKLEEIKYQTESRLPFRLLEDVPEFFSSSLKHVAFGALCKQFNIEAFELSFAAFAQHNSFLLKNQIVYLFWLVVARWLNGAVELTPTLVLSLRKHLAD